MSEQIPASPLGPHPDSQALYEASRHPERSGAKAVLRHAAGCADCSEELARLEAFHRPEPGVDVEAAWARFQGRTSRQVVEPAPQARLEEPKGRVLAFPGAATTGGSPRSVRASSRAWALAASLVLAAGLAFVWVSQRPVEEGDGLRGSEIAGQQSELFAPVGELATAPERFVFPVQGSTPLNVTLFSADGAYRWQSEVTTSGEVVLPAAERARLLPGVDYFWTVLGGAELPAKRFRLATP